MEEKYLEFDIVKTISNYGISLKKTGNNYVGCCPFHNEKDASFYVSPKKNIFHCFGCKISGSAVNFVSKMENISNFEAYKKLCIENGKPFNEPENPNKELYEITKYAANFYQYLLTNTQKGLEALDYLKSRSINESLIKEFKIGFYGNYLPEHPFLKIMEEKGYSLTSLNNAGLLNTKQTEFFQNRIIFPINDAQSNVIGFVARTFGNDVVRYLNTGETPIFKKNKVLFNIDKAKSNIDNINKEIIVVEGVFDVLALFGQGIKNTVCSLGTSFTEGQLKLLQKYCQKICFCFDGDKAGIEASFKTYKLCKSLNVESSFVLLPKGEDPSSFRGNLNDYIKENKGTFYDYFFKWFNSLVNKEIRIKEKVQSELFKLLLEEDSITKKEALAEWASICDVTDKDMTEDFINFSYRNIVLEETIDNLNGVFISSKEKFLKSISYLNKEFLEEKEKNFLNKLFMFYQKNESINEKFLSSLAEEEKEIYNKAKRNNQNVKKLLVKFFEISIKKIYF